ncbi:MAG: helix-hairpin-helix domain-containing protein [Ardenticatenales bacterium]|nr:helix-hairpin-helix domain-containing protein [Ardenticatenales bacterium]
MNHLRDLATIVLVNLAALGLIVHRLRDPRATAVRIEPAPTVTPAPSPTAIVVTVHVAGAVRRPAVVRLREGARIADAVAAAGGLADGASPALNLAAALTDGAQVYVLRTGEAAPAAGASASTDGEMSGAASPPSGPIDINRATADELDALPGVGPALAARIVAWRTANGPFTAVEDLLGVAGIGERTLERLREGVVVR